MQRSCRPLVLLILALLPACAGLAQKNAGPHPVKKPVVAAQPPASVLPVTTSGQPVARPVVREVATTTSPLSAADRSAAALAADALDNLDPAAVKRQLKNGEPIDNAFSLVALAAMSQDAGLIKLLKTRGVDLNTTDTQAGQTALHLMVTEENSKGALFLIDQGVKVNIRDTISGSTPLMLALGLDQTGVANYLILHGADVNIPEGRMAITPLQTAVGGSGLDMVKLLVEHGAQVNKKNVQGVPPLHLAVSLGKKEIVEYLLAHGADPNLPSDAGTTPLKLATRNGHREIATILKQHGAK